MQKEDEFEVRNLKTNQIDNAGIELDHTDWGTFLGRIARKLTKEGNSLEAIADKWFDDGERRNVLRSFSIDVIVLGEQLLAIRDQICQTCQLKPVNVFMNFTHNDETSK